MLMIEVPDTADCSRPIDVRDAAGGIPRGQPSDEDGGTPRNVKNMPPIGQAYVEGTQEFPHASPHAHGKTVYY